MSWSSLTGKIACLAHKSCRHIASAVDDGFKLPGLDTPLAAEQPATPVETAVTSADGNAPPLVQTEPATPSAAPTDPFAPPGTAPPASRVATPQAKAKDDFYSSDSDEETSEAASKPRRQFKVVLGWVYCTIAYTEEQDANCHDSLQFL